MALDPNDADVLEQLEEGLSLGLRGVKVYPVLAHFDPRDDSYKPFFEKVAKNNLALLWHMGASPSKRARLELSHPLLVDEVAKTYPHLVQIIAHIGHPWQRETILVLRKNSNGFSDVSAAWARPFDGYHALVRAQEWGVVDKLLFGSDYPLWTPKQAIAGLHEIAAMRAGSLPFVAEETIEKILNQDTLKKLRLED